MYIYTTLGKGSDRSYEVGTVVFVCVGGGGWGNPVHRSHGRSAARRAKKVPVNL